MSGAVRSAADLAGGQYVYRQTRDIIASIVRDKIVAGEGLFQDIFGLEAEKRRFVEILAAGRGALLSGPYGVAKTDLAKHVLELLNDYCSRSPVYAVSQCPVQEDPSILIRYVSGTAPAGQEPCPICRQLIRDSEGDLSQIAVQRLDRLVEGKGFARVQGGADVLPEEIIGTYNLLKLSELGDPFDPRVFEPGKIGQASRGVLFVDEIGKLSETAQHALIQAGQERIVTPSKSRETFPVDFLLVATTNPADEEYVCGAVRDRLVSLAIRPVDAADEMRIVRKELDKCRPAAYLPEVFLRLCVEVVRALRGDERLDIGPRTSINAGLIGRSSAMLQGRSTISFCNIKEGIYTAVLGKAYLEDRDDIEKKIDEVFPDITAYLSRQIGDVDFAAVTEACSEAGGQHAGWSPENIKALIVRGESGNALEKLVEWTIRHEAISRFRIYEVIAAYAEAFAKGGEMCGPE